MKGKYIGIGLCLVVIVIIVCLGIVYLRQENNIPEKNISEIIGTVIQITGNQVVLETDDNTNHTFNMSNTKFNIGDSIKVQHAEDKAVIAYEVIAVDEVYTKIPDTWKDNGIFSRYYSKAYKTLGELTLDEKIGQIILVKFPQTDGIQEVKEYSFGGYIFYGKDFNSKSKEQVISMIQNVQKNSKIPLLTAVDEEGGLVVRVSGNPNLVSSKFKSVSDIYNIGGLNAIKEDTLAKSKILSELGLNLNLAPVIDVATNPSDYMYDRTIQQDTQITAEYAQTVVNASKNTGVSYTLKHFPGYGNNMDTHIGSSTDYKSYENILKEDIPPFEAGIKAGAEAIMVSHNIVASIDKENPACLSKSINNILREDLNFTGIIITDDLDMKAVSSISDVAAKAILAGNDLIITKDYKKSFDSIKKAIDDGLLKEEDINRLAFRIIAWKYYKGLL